VSGEWPRQSVEDSRYMTYILAELLLFLEVIVIFSLERFVFEGHLGRLMSTVE